MMTEPSSFQWCPVSIQLRVALLEQGLGPDDLLTSLPTPTALCMCDSGTIINNNRDCLKGAQANTET